MPFKKQDPRISCEDDKMESKQLKIPFIKAQALENDFVIILLQEQDAAFANVILSELARTIANRRIGVGCDQVILVNTFNTTDELYLRFFNSDGSEAEGCGNGSRAFSLWWMERHVCDAVSFKTKGGIVRGQRAPDDHTLIDLFLPKPIINKDIYLGEYQSLSMPDPVMVTIGNPHVVLFVSDDCSAQLLGPLIEWLPQFPNGINVSFARLTDENNIVLRVWERGAGLTPACGTGAAAVAVAASVRGLVDVSKTINVLQVGGSLTITLCDEGLKQRGAASIVFEGVFLF
ncbi:MAG: diaminopimelate epimerase [Candidatus Paracaedibacteraceae bacterium]|nr:diaminopimelate epimerase [Candidatus Paracaedibacteraceae bacterium]